MDRYGLKKISDTEFEGKRVFSCEEFKSEVTESGDIYISGYVNTKGKPDSYGDIPMGDKVYDLSRYSINPVLLIDHENEVGAVLGKAVEIREDKKGLWVKFLLMKNPQSEDVVHAKEALKEGILIAFSIGGRWSFEDKNNPAYLTTATIHEISVVAVGADPRAVVSTVSSKSDKTAEAKTAGVVELLIKSYRETQNVEYLEKIKKYNRSFRWN